MKTIFLSFLLMAAAPLAAQDSCFCLKCMLGQHRMVQALSQSMAPLFEPGTCKHARYLNGEYDRLQYSDVILFLHPVNGGQYLDRVVAMGGDSIQMVDGVIWLNGAPLSQERVEDYEVIYEPTVTGNHYPMCQNNPKLGETCYSEKFLETDANGRSYEVLNLGDFRTDNTDLITIPEGFVFVLGDHRDNSIDSRFPQTGPFAGVGFVPLENIIGIIEED